MQKIWYFKKPGGQVCGPIEQDTLQRLAASGKIAADDIVWKQGTELRVLAKNVGGLDKFYVAKPPIQGRQVQTTYAQPVQGRPTSQAQTNLMTVLPTHIDPVAIQRELVVAVKTTIMAAIIVIISIMYHLIR